MYFNRKDDADRKQVFTSSKDWHIDLEKESLRLFSTMKL